ncbi:GNAT family N-acetyltransferase [Streptomyces mutabilis]|uniref:GNAT family N-acetyltransferase n=1 Tax=Streptomyces TaxID=1883 RepID=UPI000BC60CDE|nr:MULTISPECIES: GNAT family N-acetyltransferase [unclassified Streptomyces]MDN3248713.1 GNAT family N-acetyltransferase [Streptomyces sp. ZSW22]MDN3256701.1 GNAT family N-acetyltransferase [Streptomyces sp. MA25(2023)]MDQ0383568.1 CelD/BcsL family acetyltransferase involved in cellulose biosynthesis [Streptomyces sp. DSM 42143]PAK24579.1 cellulose biosynthesis protein CelD [Streptomyces sp. alain-838]
MSSKRIDVVAPGELGADDRKIWREIRAASGAPANPFMDAAFTAAVGAVRAQARVAVLREDGLPVGYFPHERGLAGRGRAIGLGVSDSQGAVLGPGIRLDARALLRACGLSSFEFDNLEAGQDLFSAHSAEELASPVVDLGGGFERYAQELRRRSPGFCKQTLAKERRLSRQVGPVRFVYDDPDPGALRTLMGWKSAQYRRTGRRDRFAQAWITRLVDLLARGEDPECRGVLSVLYAADRPVAAHFGLRSSTFLSWWFPAYDPAFGKYSPGVLLQWRMLEAAAAEGIGTVDLGSGPARYKESFKTGELRVYEGAVVRPGPGGALQRLGREPVRAARRFVRDRPRLARTAARTLEGLGRLRER